MGERATRTERHLIAAATSVVAILGFTACAGAAPAAEPDAIAAHAVPLGIDPAVVYTTSVDGYDLAPQSVNEVDDGGLSATWVSTGTGDTITLRIGAGELTDAACAALPMWGLVDGNVTCTVDGDIWHRVGGDVEEYAVARDGALIRVIGGDGYGAPAADLLAAAEAVRVPSADELEQLFSDASNRRQNEPVERGDLPGNGDGAPIDQGGEGG
ncbi:hypothetical protein BKA24_001438 [Microbacterium marinum]|uniref:Uncharacterized protein n=1 Tax=Microbacterium marinum TaxID=421115 RepID=A0A7W7FKV9_9MICO|nr:hypothetical protein [Microbacterium marinum]MBB4666729.1 hypothetical protein [Microbacterium marinum]